LRNIRFSKSLERTLGKLESKDKVLYWALLSKIEEIASSPDLDNYKNLKYGLSNFKRIHINSFVLLFRYNPSEHLVYFVDFDHHDTIYER